MLRNHVGLNYSFTLNSQYNIDGARVGNETRYINHANDDRANAHVVLKLVCGDRRIGMYALRDIKAGEEILFNYGAEYWRFQKPLDIVPTKRKTINESESDHVCT